MKRKSLEELEGIAAKATREALKGYYIPEGIWDEIARGILFEGEYRIFELYVPGGRSEDAWIISQARVHAVTGDVDVKIIGLEKQMNSERPINERGKGCAECRRRVYTEMWPLPLAIIMNDEPVSLHRCQFCGTYWEVKPNEVHMIDEDKARKQFPRAFTE